jgi:hypothetical protein
VSEFNRSPEERELIKVEYLKDGSDDCPLVRIFEFSDAEIQSLRRAFQDLASGSAEHARLDIVTSIESVDGTQVSFSSGSVDRGLVATGEKSFDVVLTTEGWRHAADLTEPLCSSHFGFQWLCDGVGDARVLLSHDGCW